MDNDFLVIIYTICYLNQNYSWLQKLENWWRDVIISKPRFFIYKRQ